VSRGCYAECTPSSPSTAGNVLTNRGESKTTTYVACCDDQNYCNTGPIPVIEVPKSDEAGRAVRVRNGTAKSNPPIPAEQSRKCKCDCKISASAVSKPTIVRVLLISLIVRLMYTLLSKEVGHVDTSVGD